MIHHLVGDFSTENDQLGMFLDYDCCILFSLNEYLSTVIDLCFGRFSSSKHHNGCWWTKYLFLCGESATGDVKILRFLCDQLVLNSDLDFLQRESYRFYIFTRTFQWCIYWLSIWARETSSISWLLRPTTKQHVSLYSVLKPSWRITSYVAQKKQLPIVRRCLQQEKTF